MRIILLFFIFSSHVLLAQSKKEKIFNQLYHSDLIDSRFCGKNSELLVRTWEEQGLDISKAEIWHIESYAGNYFGLIKYYQNRWAYFREAPYPGNPNYAANTSGGWYFHVFVVDNGKVYDLSYAQEPKVVPLDEYIMDMFVLKTDIGNASFDKVEFGLESITGYKIKAFDGIEFLDAKDKGISENKISHECGFLDAFSTGENTSCFL
jgi:hypothetical protein